MNIIIHAKPGAKHEKVEDIGGGKYVVAVRALPVEGRANAAIVRALAAYFKVAPSRVRIVRGRGARLKTAEIL